MARILFCSYLSSLAAGIAEVIACSVAVLSDSSAAAADVDKDSPAVTAPAEDAASLATAFDALGATAM
jgi:hypothetical protein